MTQAELNKNAVKSIFAIDDAKAQLESFGSQLDLGLPPEEDYEPKGFDELMTVNYSEDPNYGDSSEKFADFGDDLQDEQTQKFVIDKFAEEAAKRPGTTITASDITDICGAVQCAQLAQGGQIIKGDLVGFIQDTIAKAKNAQQSQNVSDAQPNGTVADDIAPCSDNTAGAPVDDPNSMGGPAPVMEPIEPTVEPTEPSLEPNADDPLALGDGLDDGLGALDTGIDDGTSSVDGLDGLDGSTDSVPEEGAGEEGLNAGGLDGLDDLDSDLGDIEAEDNLGLGDEDSAPAEGEGERDTKDEEPKADDTKDEEPKEDKKEDDSDDEFNFEAVAKKAQALTEGDTGDFGDVADAANTSEEAAGVEYVPEGEQTVTEEVGAETEAPAAEECGGTTAATTEKPIVHEGFNAEHVEAKIEAIAKEFRTNRIAEKVQAQIEAYEAKEKKAKTIAQIESVMNKFVKSEKSRGKAARVESIVAKFAKASKAAAIKVQMEAVAAKSDAQFKNKLGGILEAIDVKKRHEAVLKNKLNSIVESITVKPEPKSDEVGDTFAMIESAIAKMSEKESTTKAQLESIVGDASMRSEGDNLQKELDAIVDSVRKS